MKSSGIMRLMILLIALLLASCGNEKKQDYFNAVVKEVYADSFLVECIDESSENATEAPLIVPNSTISKDALPEIAVGDTIRVVYNGVNKKDFPPELETVYAIYLVDDSGNVIPN